MHSLERAVHSYICAKDNNRPHLINQAFEPDAVLEMALETRNIDFPSHTEGRDAIAELLVRRFGQTHENVYTFCIGQRPSAAALTYNCKWMVAMSDKVSKEIKVGCGRYEWAFNLHSGLAKRLRITIVHMEILPPEHLQDVMNWVSSVQHPWCAAQVLASKGPNLDQIAPIVRYISV
ncbi:hypothetical protein [Pseudomonas matsuisoli]|uniref:Uncharacterized protein n=1 Tax=Pseudomonas matsuisoli TaxID=1515666 RepID=A0A917UZ21_9PSED|nr:hypothetical protein [Pseudomonas matsuisoli]GGJ98063.1 hypothetical protein GCM10009304_24950 [Pseudomonas matsuisoli]